MQKIDFNDEIVLGLPFAPPGQHQEFADQANGSMRVVVAGSRKAFYYVPAFTPEGQNHWRLGWFPSMKTEDARRIADSLNRTSALLARSGAATRSFADVVMAYLEWLPSRERNLSTGEEVKFFKRYILDPAVNPWVAKPAGVVTDMDIAELVGKIRDRGAVATARNCLGKIQTMFRWAMHPSRRRQFGLEDNPAVHLAAKHLNLGSRRRRRHILTIPELRAYLLAIDSLPNHRDRVLALLLVLVGGRLGDLTKTRWSDIDLDQKLWWNGADHPLPLSEKAVAILGDLRRATAPEPGDLVFGARADKRVSRNRHRLKATIDRRMAEAIVPADGGRMEPWNWTDLRRTVQTILATDIDHEDVFRAAIGRSPLRWRRIDQSALRPAFERLASKLDAVRKGASEDELFT